MCDIILASKKQYDMKKCVDDEEKCGVGPIEQRTKVKMRKRIKTLSYTGKVTIRNHHTKK